jgi:hypothetical protein
MYGLFQEEHAVDLNCQQLQPAWQCRAGVCQEGQQQVLYLWWKQKWYQHTT